MYKLIIIDDEDNIRTGLLNYLDWNELGFEITGNFANGKEALEYIERYKVDAILCDVKMPIMNGIALAQEISKRKLPIKIVFLSGYAEFEYARQAMKYGVRDYILKPAIYDTVVITFTQIKEELDIFNNPNLGDDKPEGYYQKIIDAVIEYVDKNYKDATLDEAAVSVSLSPNYLSKIFKRKKGENFSEYLIDVKMQKSVELLKNINLKTYEVAFMVGYDNPKNFTRAFKQYFEKTPREFRENGC